MVTGLICKYAFLVPVTKSIFSGVLDIRADRIVQVIRLTYVEGTCPQGTCFLPGHRLLCGAHLELDVLQGLGEHLRRFIKLIEQFHIWRVNRLLTHLVMDDKSLNLRLTRGPTSTVIMRFAKSRFCEDVCKRCKHSFRYVCRCECRCICRSMWRCMWMCPCRNSLTFTSCQRSKALNVNGLHRPWVMGVNIYVKISQVSAEYLQSVG